MQHVLYAKSNSFSILKPFTVSDENPDLKPLGNAHWVTEWHAFRHPDPFTLNDANRASH
jgi:hypothetical protein